MKYFYDTEFIEDGKTIDLISIAIVAEDGREFLAHSSEYEISKASEWVKKNVLPYVADIEPISRQQIKDKLLTFIGEDKPEFWAYYADYDHVALCQLFGTMMDLPSHFPMYTRDLKQLLDDNGNPKMLKPKDEHNALADARWVRDVYQKLKSL